MLQLTSSATLWDTLKAEEVDSLFQQTISALPNAFLLARLGVGRGGENPHS